MNRRNLWIGIWLLMAGTCVLAWFRSHHRVDQVPVAGGYILLQNESGSFFLRCSFPKPMPGATVFGIKAEPDQRDSRPIVEYWLMGKEIGFGVSWLVIAGAFGIIAIWPVGKGIVRGKDKKAQQGASG